MSNPFLYKYLSILIILLTPSFVVSQDCENEVEGVISKWKSSWENKNIKFINNLYSQNYIYFDGSNKLSKEERIKKLKGTFKNYKEISIIIDKVKIKCKTNSATAIFEQEYISDKYQDIGTKVLQFQKLNNRWIITSEEFQENKLITGNKDSNNNNESNFVLFSFGLILAVLVIAIFVSGVKSKCVNCNKWFQRKVSRSSELIKSERGRKTVIKYDKTYNRNYGSPNYGKLMSETEREVQVDTKTNYYRNYYICKSCGFEWTVVSYKEFEL